MTNSEAAYESLIAVKSLEALEEEAALEHIGQLIDLSFDTKHSDGLKQSLKLSEELQKRNLTSKQSATLHYFIANTWANIRSLSRNGTDKVWEWEQPEMEKEIYHLRSALNEKGFHEIPRLRKCQIFTNLANLLDQIGRFVEAIGYWNRALDLEPSFGMARGNRGICFINYANVMYDSGHIAVFIKRAHADLKAALQTQLEGTAKEFFNQQRMMLVSDWALDDSVIDLEGFSLGTSDQEVKYRQWCLENRLFLNPLNDLGPYSIASHDILTTPSMVLGIDEGPYYQGFFNQMKQEFVSARFLYYEGIKSGKPHFSDRDVFLYNTLDYSSYSLNVEKVKMAFRTAYSLFDKISYFLNDYLELGIPKRSVSFKTFCYEDSKKGKGLRRELQQLQNWPLRGLFWLSKDLFEDTPGFKDSIEPDAQKLHDIRNHLEHKYLKLHDYRVLSQQPSDSIVFTIYRRDFESKTLRLIKMVRAALIYLALAINFEEMHRAGNRDSEIVVPEMPFYVYDDSWKI